MRKGFTLVELLAVIVILAVLALITTPILLNVIESSRKSTALNSAEGYVRAVSNYLIMNEVSDGLYSVLDNNIKAEYTGTGPSNGSIIIKKGDIESANLCINKYSIDYIDGVSSISENDYCKDTSNKTLIIKKNNEQVKKVYIGNSTNTSIEKEEGTNIVCNNGVTLKEEDGKIKVENILGNSECNFSNNLEETINNIDSTKNNILLLSDINLGNTLTIPEGKDVVIDLNGKTINENTIGNYGLLTLKNSSADESSFNVSGTVLVNYENATADLENVKLISSSNRQATSTILNGGKLKITNCYVEGPYGIGWNDKPTTELNIYNSEVVGTISNGISFNTSSGSGNIYSSNIKGKVYAIYFNSTGTLNIYSGTFIGETSSAINNATTGTVNIKQTDEPIYITSLATTWNPAVNNSNLGIINISGKQANACTSESNDTTSGICIYTESTTNGGIRNQSGTINIDGATIYGGNQGVNNNWTGIINILNSKVSSSKYAILNNAEGTINVCSADVSSTDESLHNTSTGYIYYTNNVNLSSGKIYDVNTNDPTHVVLKNDITCE